MKDFLKKLAVYFGAGAIGGLASGMLLWYLGKVGITSGLGVKLVPRLTALWAYESIVWGGIWGAMFFFPIRKMSPLATGLLLSLGPSLGEMFYFIPVMDGKGLFGFGLGKLTPLIVLFISAVWGVVAAFYLRICGEL